jgi:hypothetical protein
MSPVLITGMYATPRRYKKERTGTVERIFDIRKNSSEILSRQKQNAEAHVHFILFVSFHVDKTQSNLEVVNPDIINLLDT